MFFSHRRPVCEGWWRVGLGFLAMSGPAAEPFPEPLPFAPPVEQRRHLGRVLTRLQSGTLTAPPTVRVLFYGQSITEQAWWKRVAEFLRTTYPEARWVIENRAIGGHSSQLLVKTAEADLYPFQPDLLIFHVYGAHDRYEDILRRVRERTTADILLQTDHVTRPEMLREETDPAKLTPKNWDAWMNYSFLPGVAARYGACRADIHELWKRHLRDTQTGPADFLRDGVHLNERGEFVMAALLQPYLAPFSPDELRAAQTALGPDFRVRDLSLTPESGTARASFTGNRVDVKPLPGQSWRVLIDGAAPTVAPGVVGFQRVAAFPLSNWPMLLQVQSESLPIPETWTLTLDEIAPDGTRAAFHLRGSQTGEDGAGVSTNRFVSRSRRVVLEPGDWNLAYCYKVFHRALSPGTVITWEAEARGIDTVTMDSRVGVAEPGWVTVAQGLTNGPHTVAFTGVKSGPVTLRVHRPPLTPGPAAP